MIGLEAGIKGNTSPLSSQGTHRVESLIYWLLPSGSASVYSFQDRILTIPIFFLSLEPKDIYPVPMMSEVFFPEL